MWICKTCIFIIGITNAYWEFELREMETSKFHIWNKENKISIRNLNLHCLRLKMFQEYIMSRISYVNSIF